MKKYRKGKNVSKSKGKEKVKNAYNNIKSQLLKLPFLMCDESQ